MRSMSSSSSVDRDELDGQDQPALGCVPAHQRFGADDAPGVERDLGLPVEDELPGVERSVQVAFEQQAARRLGQPVGEDLDA